MHTIPGGMFAQMDSRFRVPPLLWALSSRALAGSTSAWIRPHRPRFPAHPSGPAPLFAGRLWGAFHYIPPMIRSRFAVYPVGAAFVFLVTPSFPYIKGMPVCCPFPEAEPPQMFIGSPRRFVPSPPKSILARESIMNYDSTFGKRTQGNHSFSNKYCGILRCQRLCPCPHNF